MKRLSLLSLLALLGLAGDALGYTPTAVPSNALLSGASTITYPGGLQRDTFGNGNGAPPMQFVPGTGPCSLNGGNGDGGSQVKSADGKCWLGVFPAKGGDPRQWGVKTDGTDSSAGMQAAVNWAAQGKELVLPPGVIAFGTGLVATVHQLTMLNISGAGVNNSFLEYSGASGTALTVNEPDSQNSASFHFRNFTLTSTHPGGANGFAINYTGSGAVKFTYPVINSFENVMIQGSDGPQMVNYFTTGISLSQVSWVNFLVGISGPQTAGPAGVGITAVATGAIPGIVYNILPGSNFWQLDAGLSIGTETQGYQISGTNFTGNNRGIYIPPGGTAVFQVAVANSQFGPCVIYCFDSETDPTTTASNIILTGNLFFAPNNAGHAAINLANARDFNITGNQFSYQPTPNVGDGIHIGQMPNIGGLIANNTFLAMKNAITLDSGSQNVMVGPNVHSADTCTGCNYLVNNGPNTNTGIDINFNYTPEFVSCGSGSATFSAASGTYNVTGNIVNIDISITIGTTSSCNNIAYSLPTLFNNVAVSTAGAGVDDTIASPITLRVDPTPGGGPAAGNMVTGLVTAGHIYLGHLTYKIVSPF
jgi:hypothetical protein